MGISLGGLVNKAVRGAANLEKGAASLAQGAKAKVDAAASAELGKLRQQFLQLADQVERKLSSAPNKGLVVKELALAQKAQNAKLSPVARRSAQNAMRLLMGGEPNPTHLDPLPAACSPTAEKARATSAVVADPAATTAGQWATNDPAGKRNSDPVNLYVHGNLADIVRAFQRGGWSIADPNDAAGRGRCKSCFKNYLEAQAIAAVHSASKEGDDSISQDVYHAINKMPVGTMYLNGQPQLVSMEANNHPLTGRDHFRIFATGQKDAEGRNIYAVAASRDEGLKLEPSRGASRGFSNHFTERDADYERDFALETLLAGGAQAQSRELPRTFAQGPRGGLYSGDGKVCDVIVG